MILFFHAFSSPFQAYVGEDALSSAPPKFGTPVKMHMQRVAIDSHVSLFGNLKTLFYPIQLPGVSELRPYKRWGGGVIKIVVGRATSSTLRSNDVKDPCHTPVYPNN
jgi:hypothetical protein